MMDGLQPYLAFARGAFRRETAYRVSILVAMGGFATRVYVLQFVWTALYRAGAAGTPGGIPLPKMLAYMIVGQLLTLLLRSNSADQIRQKVREGAIAVDLMRPVSFPLYLLAEDLGATALNLLLLVPAVSLAFVLADFHLPTSGQLAAFVLSLVMAYVVQFHLHFLISLTAFWTQETLGLPLAQEFAALLLSGVVVPLWFLPEGLSHFARLLPFASVYNTPLSIYIGRLGGTAILPALLLQGCWIGALTFIIWSVWSAAARRLAVQGG